MMDEAGIARIVDRVVERLRAADPAVCACAPAPVPGPAPRKAPGGTELAIPTGRHGVHETVDQATGAARRAFASFEKESLEVRERVVTAMREVTRKYVQELSAYAHQETGLGRAADKVKKNLLVVDKTPGPEILRPPGAWSGDDGLTIVERAPFGVIGALTPCTNPTETILCNGIGMVAGGNAVVFGPHPLAWRTSAWHIHLLNEAIVSAGGPRELLNCVAEPTLAAAQELMAHEGVRLLVVTGGGEVVRAAMRSGKKAICGGPGNPPVVVDETADLRRAATGIIAGASTDNNIICSDEKEIIAVEAIADRLREQLRGAGAYELSETQLAKLERVIFEDGHVARRFIGQNASTILREIEVVVPDDCRLAFVQTDETHPLVQHEQLMPILPLVRVSNWEEAIACAARVEHGHGHTAVMYSTHIDHLHRMASTIDTCIFVKNAPSLAGLGMGGEGHTSWTIAHPTGEGLTTAVNFTRERRCTLKDHFRIV